MMGTADFWGRVLLAVVVGGGALLAWSARPKRTAWDEPPLLTRGGDYDEGKKGLHRAGLLGASGAVVDAHEARL